MDIYETLAELARDHDVSLTLERRYDEGKNGGAFLVLTPTGEHRVLKVWSQRSIEWAIACRTTLDKARRAGWLSPPWVEVGRLSSGNPFAVQERAVGHEVEVVDVPTARALIDVNRLQSGLGHPQPSHVDYPARINGVLFRDDRDETAKLQAFSDEAAMLVSVISTRVDRITWPTSDLVHGDYSRANILMGDGLVSGLIDLDNIGWGSRVFDLADQYRQMVLFDDPAEARALVRQEIESVAGRVGFYSCFAFWVIVNLSWAVDAVPQSVEGRIHVLSQFVESAEYQG